jgi:hypothetical protein
VSAFAVATRYAFARGSLWVAAVLMAGFGAGACSVDRDVLQERLFMCSTSEDCGPEWGCARASPYASDFCAPRCGDGQCDGICVRQQGFRGERTLCLSGCRIAEDGTTSGCSADGYSCIRVSVESNEGVCYPVDSCSHAAQCGKDELCLSELVAPVAGDIRSDNLYCVPTAESEGGCPARSLPVDVGERRRMCLATCTASDTRCPPGSGCMRPLAVAGAANELPCFPGLYGVPCNDDTNCLFGQCEDVGDAGRICTTSCDEAARIAGGCGGLMSVERLGSVFHLECDPQAGGGEEGGLCVTRYGTGYPCTTPDSDAYQCAEGLQCRTLATGEGEQKLCTRECTTDRECNEGERESNYCLHGGPGGGVCLPKRPAGAECFAPEQCLSGVCREGECDERDDSAG